MDNAKLEPVQGFEGYAVSSDGRVYSRRTAWGLRTNYIKMTPRIDAKGYLGVILCGLDGTRRSVRVHRLIAETLLPNASGHPCVRHLDGNPQNNAASNLAWGSYQDNEHDKKRHGTYDTRRNGKLCEKSRALVLRLAGHGVSQRQIAKLIGVSRPTITRFLNGTTWSGMDA